MTSGAVGPVLVTGATGFVGRWTVVALLRAGHAVRGTVRSLDRGDEVRAAVAGALGADPGAALSFAAADLLADDGWDAAVAGTSAVLHVAAAVRADEPPDPALVIRPAVEGTERVLRAAARAGVRRVVLTSSIATVGYGHGPIRGRRTFTEDDHTDLDGLGGRWAYAEGKTRAERAAWALAEAHGLALTTIHPGAILGPPLGAAASPSLGMVTGLLAGATPALPRVGFSVVDARDVADLHVAALRDPSSVGRRYLAAAGYVPFRELAAVLRAAYPDRAVPTREVPDWVLRVAAWFGGPARTLLHDLGHEKHFDGARGAALLGRAYLDPRTTILDTAAGALRTGLVA